MASPINFYLLLFIFTCSAVNYGHAILERYIPLISDVHDTYRTSSVFFISTNIQQHVQEFVLLHFLSREFSQKAVLTLVINFDVLGERIKMWRYRVSRPLIVVMLTSDDEVTDFIVHTRDMNISNPLWLVIFTDEFGEAMCEYCNNPIGNIFSLRFDTEMLVACCRDPLITEWWAVHDNKTEVANFGNWTEKGLELFTTQGLYERRHDVNGTGLRVIILKNPLLIREFGPIQEGGFLYQFFMELKRSMNFAVENLIMEDSFGIWNSATNTWSGALSKVIEGNADIGVAEFTITNRRRDAVDFSFPLMVTRTQLYIKEPDGLGVQWSAYFEAFTCEAWMAIILLVIATPILLTLMKIKSARCESLLSLFFENSIQVWGIFCQQGLYKFPVETPLKIAYFSIFVSALVVSSTYSASFISFLTVSTVSLPFSTMEGFAQDGSYKLIVLQNSSDYDLFTTSTEPVLVQMKKMLKPWYLLPSTLSEGFEQVCRERVAFYTNEAMVKSMNAHSPCKMIRVETGRIDSLAMILSHESQYTGVVNYHIQRYKDNGMMHRLKEKYLLKQHPTEPITHTVVTVWGVAPILSILTGGIILAFIILFGERLCKSCKIWAQKRQRAHLRRMMIKRWLNVLEKERRLHLQLPRELRIDRFNNLPTQYHW